MGLFSYKTNLKVNHPNSDPMEVSKIELLCSENAWPILNIVPTKAPLDVMGNEQHLDGISGIISYKLKHAKWGGVDVGQLKIFSGFKWGGL